MTDNEQLDPEYIRQVQRGAFEANILEKMAGSKMNYAEFPPTSKADREYLWDVLMRAMFAVDELPVVTRETARVYRALQKALVELANNPPPAA